MMNLIDEIVAYTDEFRRRAVEPEAIVRAKQLVLDTMGVCVSSWNEPSIAAIFASAEAESGKELATVYGTGKKAPVEQAIVCNGALTRVQDYMDVYYSLDASHPSEYIPFTLACCEAWNLTGDDALRGIILAYDLQGWITENLRCNRNGWHYATFASAVSAAVVALLRNLSAEQLANTIAISCSTNLTALGTGPQTDMKTLAFALAAQNVLMSARLAANGCTGPRDTLETLLGITGNAGKEFPPLRPEHPRILKTSIKPYPSEFMAHSALEALESILQQQTLAAEQVDKICVRVHQWATWIARESSYHPHNRQEADHSLPYCIAARIVAGKLDQSEFQNRYWENEAVLALMQKIRVVADDALEALYPQARPAIVEITCKDGRVLTARVDHPLGDYRNPMTQAQVEEKFRDCVKGTMDDEKAQRVIDAVDQMQSHPSASLTELMVWE